MVRNIFPFGNKEYLPFIVLILIRKFITPDFSVTVRSEFGTVLQLIKTAVMD